MFVRYRGSVCSMKKEVGGEATLSCRGCGRSEVLRWGCLHHASCSRAGLRAVRPPRSLGADYHLVPAPSRDAVCEQRSRLHTRLPRATACLDLQRELREGPRPDPGLKGCLGDLFGWSLSPLILSLVTGQRWVDTGSTLVFLTPHSHRFGGSGRQLIILLLGGGNQGGGWVVVILRKNKLVNRLDYFSFNDAKTRVKHLLLTPNWSNRTYGGQRSEPKPCLWVIKHQSHDCQRKVRVSLPSSCSAASDVLFIFTSLHWCVHRTHPMFTPQ